MGAKGLGWPAMGEGPRQATAIQPVGAVTGGPGSAAEIGDFARFNEIAAAAGLAFVVVANALFVQVDGVWVMVPILVVFIGLLDLARRAARRGDMLRSLLLISIANWSIALIVSFLFPFLWPVMALNVLMPLALATPHVAKRELAFVLTSGAVVIACVGAVGLLRDDDGMVEDIADEFELALVLAALVAQTVPIGLVIWQNNQLQRRSLDRSMALNESLRESERRLADSRRRVVRAADVERSRIERDLHDGAQQRLVALGVHLRLLESRTASDPPAAIDEVNRSVAGLVGDLDLAIEELRELAHGIYPPLLEARGLAEAFGAVVRRSPSPVTFTADDVGRHGPAIEAALYFAGLEALTNATKHAPDADVALSVTIDGGDLELSVTDDGPGFDSADAPVSRGLLNMRDRIAAVGGTITVDSAPGHGTSVLARVPTDSGT